MRTRGMLIATALLLVLGLGVIGVSRLTASAETETPRDAAALLAEPGVVLEGEDVASVLTTKEVVAVINYWYIAPIASVLALLVAYYFFTWMKAQNPGNEAMIRIAGFVQQGAMAYLRQQYKVVSVFFVILFLLLAWMAFGLGAQSPWVPFAFLTGGFFSGLAGFFGMRTATWASNRTAQGAMESLDKGLKVAFRSGAVMGLTVVGLGLIDICIWFYVLHLYFHLSLVETTVTMLCFGMGASTQALFARVGGGIFTKAADVGADLVGKVEAGIPEDDPRNPATIADNVGDNVGDVAGMGADLYESYCGSILATAALGVSAAVMLGHGYLEQLQFVLAPMVLAGVGILLSIVGIFLVKTREGASLGELLNSLRFAIYGSSAIIGVIAYFVCQQLLPSQYATGVFAAIAVGLAAGCVIGYFTEYYTAFEYKPTQLVAESCQMGPAPTIISGVAAGMWSTWVPIATIGVGTILAYGFAGGFGSVPLMGLYGVGFAAVGMLATLGITLATDAYGPIADNAGGNAEMAHLPKEVREKTDQLDSLGNTTAATGKGFAIGSAALTALALLAAYIEEVRIGQERDGLDTVRVALQKVDVAERKVGTWEIVEQDGGENGVIRRVALLKGAKDAAANPELLAKPESLALKHTSSFMFIRGEESSETLRPQLAGFLSGIPDGQRAALKGYGLVEAHKATLMQYMNYYQVNLMTPNVLVGMFFGVLMVFTFCALTMKAVGAAANDMIAEVRRQFAKMRAYLRAQGKSEKEANDPANWPSEQVNFENEMIPNYHHCVEISTRGAQKRMVVPSMMAIVVPIVVGLALGVSGVMGLLAGGLVSGFAVAIFMANAGGSWDNAKKFIEKGNFGGKGSDAHKAAVVGDTVGDPFKDTSGPSLNILIKLMSMVSVVFAGLIVKFSPPISQAIKEALTLGGK